MAASLWCAELGLTSIILERRPELGGQLLQTHNQIANYPGVDAANGRGLRDIFNAQIDGNSTVKKLGIEATALLDNGAVVQLSSGEKLAARAVIIATGVRRRRLNVAGEIEFIGRGVLQSGVNESDSARGKTVVVVGGGDAALENALILAAVAKRVFLIHRSNRFSARAEFIERVSKNGTIEVLCDSVVTAIVGDRAVGNVQISNNVTGQISDLETDAIIVRIGFEPNSEMVRGVLNTDSHGYIHVDPSCETSLTNVFAIGDVANPLAPTISTAVGQAAIAVKVIAQRLR